MSRSSGGADCVDGKASGEGRLIWHTRFGRHVYEGNMVAGKQHGSRDPGAKRRRSLRGRMAGRQEARDRHLHLGPLATATRGGWSDDRPHGFGTATFADGDVHEGEWRMGCYGEPDGIWSALIATVEDCGFN